MQTLPSAPRWPRSRRARLGAAPHLCDTVSTECHGSALQRQRWGRAGSGRVRGLVLVTRAAPCGVAAQGRPRFAPRVDPSRSPAPHVLLLLTVGAPRRRRGAVTVTLLCLLRDASPANLLPASAAEFPGLIPCSGSSFNPFLPAAALREAPPSTQESPRACCPWLVSWWLCCDPLAVCCLWWPDLTLFPRVCRRGRSIFQLGETVLHPSRCPQLSCNLCLVSLPIHSCTASPCTPWQAELGLGAAVVGAALGAGAAVGRDTLAPLAPIPGESRQHLPSARGCGAGVGQISHLGRGPAGQLVFGLLPGFPVTAGSFQCPPFHAMCGNLVPIAHTCLPEPICAGQPLGRVPPLPAQRYQSAPHLCLQHSLCWRRGLVATQRAGITLPGCLTSPHNARALAGTPTRPLSPGCSEPEGKGGWCSRRLLGLGDGSHLPAACATARVSQAPDADRSS